MYKCKICERLEKDKRLIRRHIKIKHRIEWIQNKDEEGKRLPLNTLYEVVE